MRKSWTGSGRRRLGLLFASCTIPLLFIGLTTSFFHPEYFDKSFLTPEPVQSVIATKAPSNTETIHPWDQPFTLPEHSRPDAIPSILQQPAEELPEGWAFDTKRDERNFGLSDAQCDAAFPDFYKEIDRAVAFRHENDMGKVNKEDIDIAWRDGEIMRIMLYDRQLYVIDAKWATHGYDLPRALALLHSMHRAIVASSDPLPNIEFSIVLGDWAGDSEEERRWPVWVLSRHWSEEDKWVMPDFGYWSWPLDVIGDYSQVRRDIHENEPAWRDKIPKAVWRGSSATNELREQLVNVSKGKSWSDVHEIKWENRTTLAPGMKDLSLSMAEHCNYKYALHTEGHSYSGRGKYLLNCNSVSVIHKPNWIEPHTHLFVPSGPSQNIIEVSRDFSDLNSKMKAILKHDSQAQRIAHNSVKMFRDRYLTPAAQACYWRKMFHAWNGVSIEPEFYRTVKDSRGVVRRKGRGTSFESFVASLVLPNEEDEVIVPRR